MHLSFSVALSVLILLEIIRIYELEPWSPSRLDEFMRRFTNEKDRGIVIVSHFYLLVGCALPVWLVSMIQETHHWLAYIGLGAVGIGDSVVRFAFFDDVF